MNTKLPDYIAYRIARLFKSEPDTLITSMDGLETNLVTGTSKVFLTDRNGIAYTVTVEVEHV